MGGVRPDPLPWHPNGLAIDVMIPNPGTTEGIALGNEIVSYVLRNAARFGMQDAIWRGVYYTPNGAQRGGGYGHYDHVHVTTHGGGYPTGQRKLTTAQAGVGSLRPSAFCGRTAEKSICQLPTIGKDIPVQQAQIRRRFEAWGG